jgi:hypothetical protein
MAAIVSTRHIALLHPPRLRCLLLVQCTSVRPPCWNYMAQVNLERVFCAPVRRIEFTSFVKMAAIISTRLTALLPPSSLGCLLLT